MQIKDIARRLTLLPSALGWAGGVGVACLAGALVVLFALLLPAREEGETLNRELQQMRSAQAQAPGAMPAAATARQQFDEFLASLPAEDEVNAQINQLYDFAARNRLTLKDGEYRTTSVKGGRIGRLQITVKSQGSYSDVRRLLRGLPAVLPALSISRFSMARQKSSDAALETVVEFSLYYRKAQA